MIFGGVFLLFAILMFLARKESVDESRIKSKLQKCFNQMGFYLYKKILIVSAKNPNYGEKVLQWFHSGKVRKDLQTLKPNENIERLQTSFYVHKISTVLLLLFIGNVSAVYLSVHSRSEGILADGAYIQRNTYGAGNIQGELYAESVENGWKKHILLEVGERRYTTEELDAMYESAVLQLESIVLGDNQQYDKVKVPLRFEEEIEGYPFHIIWESSDDTLIDAEGMIQKREIEQTGEQVEITAIFTYFEYRKEYSFSVTVYPLELSGQEEWEIALEKELEKEEAETMCQEQYWLPMEVAGEKTRWREKREDYSYPAFFMMVVAAVLIYMLQDKDLHQKIQDKNQKMILEYPAFISKLTLYLGAGMTINKAWKKIAYEYRQRKEQGCPYNHTYEEMLFTCYEIDSGISQAAAYDRFGKRCGLQSYRKLSTLLIQNLKKGNSGFIMQLREEADFALEERKNMARKLGEEAGTKLLFPMMLMLGIVMILILIPAFLSFSI